MLVSMSIVGYSSSSFAGYLTMTAWLCRLMRQSQPWESLVFAQAALSTDFGVTDTKFSVMTASGLIGSN